MSAPKSGEGDCLCLCGLKSNTSSSTSDKNTFCKDHLHNWELWMKRRKRVHERLAKIGREPGNLLMNINEEVRNVKEDRLMLEYLKIETNFDKYRGNPAFFKLPDALGNRNKPPFTLDPTYFAIMTREEKNEIPEIEYVTVPDDILREKGVLPRDRDLYRSWQEKNTYRQNKILRNADKLKKVEKHKPDLKSLIVIGKRFGNANEDNTKENPVNFQLSPDKQSSDDNKIKAQEFDETNNVINLASETKFPNDIDNEASSISKTVFKINHIEFFENSPAFSYCKSINVLFERYSDDIVPTEKTLLIENVGITTLRLYWKSYQKTKLFREFTNACPIENTFKFNKSELLLLPKQKIDFPFWFTSKEPGGYRENWEITTLPNIVENNHHIIVSLRGFVFVEKFDNFAANLKEMLEKKVTEAIVKDILEEVVRRGNYCIRSDMVVNDFSEKELFESQNLTKETSILKPKYIYDPKIIKELKQFYREVKRVEDSEHWNLSIKFLKQLAREKDINVFAKEKTMQYARSKCERENMLERSATTSNKKLKTVDKDEKTISTKTSAVKTVKGTVTISHIEVPETPSFHKKLETILQKLLKPSTIPNTERKKYLFGYFVIRFYLCKMFEEIEYFEGKCIEFPSTHTTTNIPERLVFEKFNESYIKRTKRMVPEGAIVFKTLPKTLLLKDIPLEDAKKVYRIYFGKEVVDDKGKKKGKGKPDEKSPVGSQKTKPSKENKQQKEKTTVSNVLLETKEDFYPFSHEFSLPENIPEQKVDIKLKPSTSTESTENSLDYEQKYLIVYTNLCDAIDTLVDTIEICKSVEASPNVLKEMQNCDMLPPSTSQNEVDDVLAQDGSMSKSENISKASFKKGVDKARSVTNIVQADVTNPTKMPSINDEYFNFLVESHLNNNILTQKYIVNEEMPDEIIGVSEKNLGQEIDLKKSLSNAFSLSDFQIESIPFGYREAEAQTIESKVELMADLEKYLGITNPTNISSLENAGKSEVVFEESNSAVAKKSSDIFYFLNNSEQEEI